MKKLLSSIIVALGCITDDYLIFEYACDYPEHGPKFYGFPFAQETNSTWVFSMSGEIYLLGFLGNLIFWTVIITGLVFLVSKLNGRLVKKITKLLGWLIIAWSLFISFVYFAAIDWRVEFTHDDFKINYYQSDIDCKRQFFLKKHR